MQRTTSRVEPIKRNGDNMFNFFGRKNALATPDGSGPIDQDNGSFHVGVELTSQDVEAPPLEKGEDGRYKFPIAKAVADSGGTATLAALVMALIVSAPAMASDCLGRVVTTNSHAFCLRLTDAGEARVDVMGSGVSMVRLNGGMFTMVAKFTRTVPDDRRSPVIFNAKAGISAIAEAGPLVRAIENNAAARQHLRIK